MCSRILIGQAVFWVCFVSWTANFAAAQDGADVNERFRQATAAMREGHLDDAGEGFAAIVKETPNFAEAHLNLGLVLQEQNRFEQARASFQRALTLKPKLRGANLFLGVALFRLNHLDQAVVAIQKETTAYPKDSAAWMWLGVLQLAQGKPEDAAEALDKAAKLAPDDMDVLYYRGRAHLLVSKNSYGRMFKVDPRSWRVYQVMAQANAEADRHVDAIAEYQEAIKLAPMQPGLHEELGSEYSIAAKPLDATWTTTLAAPKCSSATTLPLLSVWNVPLLRLAPIPKSLNKPGINSESSTVTFTAWKTRKKPWLPSKSSRTKRRRTHKKS